MSHTPGPWRILGESRNDGRVNGIGGPDGEVIVESDDGCYPPTRADAQLIAAAPDLLEACRLAVAWVGLDGDGISEPVRSQLLNAIAKAEGRP